MPSTYTPIATTTLGSATNTVTFSSISGSYTDLILIYAGTLSADGGFALRFNSDTGTNYSNTALFGDGSTAGSNRNSNDTSMGLGYGGTAQNVTTMQIQNYSNSTTYKTALSRNNGGGYVSARVGMWRNTAAVTTVAVLTYSGNFATGSTFTLYGVKSA